MINKGILISRDKQRLLRNIKRSMNLSMKLLKHIQNYQRVYRNVIKENKKERQRELFFQLRIRIKQYGQLLTKKQVNTAEI
jgi:hypothetical protein